MNREPKEIHGRKETGAGNLSRRLFIKLSAGVAMHAVLGGAVAHASAFSSSSRDARENAVSAAEGASLREIAGRRLHHGANRFLSPFTPVNPNKPWSLLSWKMFARNEYRRFYKDEPVTPVSVDLDVLGHDEGLSVTLVRHSFLIIRDRGFTIYIDPVFGAVTPLLRDFAPLAMDVSALPRPDCVLITHDHYDHLDRHSLKQISDDATVIAPLGHDDLLQCAGKTACETLDWFESWSDPQREIILVPCNHWTMRNPLIGANRRLWGGYIIRTAAGPTIFISGDTGYFPQIGELGAEYDIDLAVFYLSAYEPRWFMRHFHLNPEETVRSFRQLKARKLMIAHWGAFRLGDEPVHFPPMDIEREMRKQHLESQLVQLPLGKTWVCT